MLDGNAGHYLALGGILLGVSIVLFTRLNTKWTTPSIITGLSIMAVSIIGGITILLS